MRCFLFPHTHFIRCYESLPAYAWKGFLFVRKISGSRNNSEFSHCSSYGKEKSKFFHSEGLKTRGCFCIWWRISDPTEKTEYFFRQRGCIFPPRCPKEMEGSRSLRSLTTEWPSERDMTSPWRRKAKRSDAAVRIRGRHTNKPIG